MIWRIQIVITREVRTMYTDLRLLTCIVKHLPLLKKKKWKSAVLPNPMRDGDVDPERTIQQKSDYPKSISVWYYPYIVRLTGLRE